tara:strand:- start:9151 stop:9258 length:108 start_codon:yes stop_codon:yes gene_type:complete
MKYSDKKKKAVKAVSKGRTKRSSRPRKMKKAVKGG